MKNSRGTGFPDASWKRTAIRSDENGLFAGALPTGDDGRIARVATIGGSCSLCSSGAK
jgi:hypothetical protein